MGFRLLAKNGQGYVYIKTINELTEEDFRDMVYVGLSGGVVPEYNSQEYISYTEELKSIEYK